MNLLKSILFIFSFAAVISCSSDDSNTVTEPVQETETETETVSCTSDQILDDTRGDCDVTLPFTSEFVQTTGNTRRFTVNSIPNHKVGLFGGGPRSLNPNAISEQNLTYNIPIAPTVAEKFTPLLANGPQYSFGILLNGVELDPVAAEPFPHEGIMSPNVNWEWNLEALNVNLGLDCNNAHVQATGKYHYHGTPTLYLQSLNVASNEMTLVGYAADGFPIYYKYAYSDASDSSSPIVEMTSSYQLKSGARPGDGVTAPCDTYNGIYSNDYEYSSNLGTLDEANGRTGVTPEYPSGTYYYVITDEFPAVPRYFRGTPSGAFKIGA